MLIVMHAMSYIHIHIINESYIFLKKSQILKLTIKIDTKIWHVIVNMLNGNYNMNFFPVQTYNYHMYSMQFIHGI